MATREVKVRTIPGSVRSAASDARLQVIFANQRIVTHTRYSNHNFSSRGGRRWGVHCQVFSDQRWLTLGECPSSSCPTGRHSPIPEACIEWMVEEWRMGDNGKEGRQRDCRCQHNQWESAQLCHKSKQEEHSGESIRIWNSSLWVDFWFCQFISEGVWWSMQFLRPWRRPSSTSDCQQSMSQSLCQEPFHWLRKLTPENQCSSCALSWKCVQGPTALKGRNSPTLDLIWTKVKSAWNFIRA